MKILTTVSGQLLVVMGVLLGITLTGCSLRKEPVATKVWVPNEYFRPTVAHIRPESVAKIHLYGPRLRCFEYDPIVVSSPQSVALLVKSLQNAEKPPPPPPPLKEIGIADKTELLVIYFHKQKPGSLEPVRISFNSDDPKNSFGPQFAAALRTVVGNIKARE